GLFNWNNSFIFAHDVLNHFTNSFTASETPFTAFCLVMRRTYMEHGFEQSFCSVDTFIRVWFAFIRLQDLDSSMLCPTCGPSPSVVIADGVSLAPQMSKLTSHIRPPTTTTAHSERVETISSYRARGLPFIKTPALRALLTKFLDSTKVFFTNILDTTPLAAEYPSLHQFMMLYLSSGRQSPHYMAYRTLLSQISAPDIALQLVPFKAIPILRSMTDPNYDVPVWLQSLVPAMGHAINSHRTNSNGHRVPLPLELRAVAGWMADRANDVYSRLAQHDPAPIQVHGADNLGSWGDWRQTGTCYGLPQIRSRRVYPKLRNDGSPTDRLPEDKSDSGCNKYYSTYSKSNLAGGIMVLWCTHSICLGFHTMPVAEGRNDVFAAIYTHFPVAPEIIVYDYACQLAAYSLVREACFFRDTRFLIDELHAHGHSGCGQACFASNAMTYDERVRAINTSAAECGNGGLKRIRKSVSYMTYEHTVLYTKAFFDVWNRSIA
ncbi:hypothetical protein BXZ70DRAFT_1036489, partial [Cristinia sonorae]